ncbi:MAG: transcriptional regulator [Candidatus Scalindua rubra]|uniref:Transcriptional regulator n=1 Tax=Candidatus Scalindua rubra TaxID=1872076 RepID=A0A1E3X919_9BACT|nr:MAG: transcriptional regulator [Candidatus Scalindua rubra]
MKRILIFLTLCFMPSFFLLGASEPQLILDKLDSLEKAISDLSLRILVLEKRIISLEEKFLLEATKKTEKQPGRTLEPEGFGYSGDDFSIEDVTYETHYNDTIFRGTITNNSNNNYRYTLFKISVYDKKGAILSSNDFYILNIDKGTTRSFEAKIHGVKVEEFERYSIEFTKGS